LEEKDRVLFDSFITNLFNGKQKAQKKEKKRSLNGVDRI